MLHIIRESKLRTAAIFTLLLTLGVLMPAANLQAATEEGESEPIVTAIEFAPTQYLSEADMLSAITQTKIGEPLDTEKLIADLEAIFHLSVERHGQQVFYDIEADLITDGDGVKVVVYPIEVPPAETITASGYEVDIELVDEEVFLKHFTLDEGIEIDVNELVMAIYEALDKVRTETGYIYEITGLELDTDNIVHMQFRAHRIASVAVEGNEKTRDYVIEREITAEVGEPLNEKKLGSDYHRIIQLRHFNNLDIEYVRREENPLHVDLIYRVEERQTGSAAFGAGYSSADGLGGYLELADENLFGRGQHASIRWEFASRKSSYDLSFYEPNIAGTRYAAGFGLYNTVSRGLTARDDSKYTDHSVGGQVTFGKRFTDFLQGSLRLRVRDTVKEYEDDSTVEDRTRSILLSLSGDTTDHPFYPTVGMRYGVSTELARKFWGGGTHFDKYEGNWSYYHKVGSNDQVIAVRLMGGISPVKLLDQDMFRVGGADTVRALNYGSVTGDKMLVGNAEYRFKISDTVQGAVFADVGNAWETAEPVTLSDLKSALGLGIRFETPLGMMRLDYGIGEQGGRVFFSIGPSF